ncbi:MAG: 4Fe-4S single cluster domain-containing protein [bacterium]|nr:4Fe-4S single cluster domain-containing protein [bacterium]
MSAFCSVGRFQEATRAMGPGLRACLWMRGCPFRCRGCATPELQAFARDGRGSEQHTVAQVSAWIDRAKAEHGIDGVSFSGGDPFAQAPALVEIARHARVRGLSTLAWSGYTLRELRSEHAPVGAQALLEQLDVLIDGRFVQRLAAGDPLRGSSNQRMHLLTGRHTLDEFLHTEVEVVVAPDGTLVTGVTDYELVRVVLDLADATL